MRQLSWALIGMTGLIAAGTAQAGMTCKIVPGWCPAPEQQQKIITASSNNSEKTDSDHHGDSNNQGWNNPGSNNQGSDHGDHGDHGGDRGPTSVPEPATLLLLGAGISAVGAATARRRKRK